MENKNTLPAKTSQGNQGFKGIVPIVKSFLFGTEDGIVTPIDDIPNSYTTQNLFQFLTGTHEFNYKGLRHLVRTGYERNPVGFGVIRKILLAQRNIVFTPYWKGKPYKSKTFDFDVNMALQMLITTGTCICYKQKIVGFPDELKVLNTLNIIEVYSRGQFKYQLDMLDGTRINLSYEDMIFIKFDNITSTVPTNLGISPFQAAAMPIESLKYMYEADTAALKNSGVNGILTNDTDEPMVGVEQEELQKKLNKQISGAKKVGQIAASTFKLRFLQLGKTAKEFQLWDGYKYKNRDLCTVLQIDSGQANDPDNKKFANVQESNKALYTDCVIPFTRMITDNQEIINFLGYEIFLDTSNIDCLQEAQSIRFEKNKTLTQAIFDLNENVKNGIITYDAAVFILTNEWGYGIDESKQVIMVREVSNDQTADKLNTLSPIVATKVMESTTTNERRGLIGLSNIDGGDQIPSDAPAF